MRLAETRLMPAADKPQVTYEEVLTQAGFFRQGQPIPGTTWSGDALRAAPSNGSASRPLLGDNTVERIDRAFRYQALLRPTARNGRLELTHLYELSGAPCVVFKRLSAEPSASALMDQLFAWQRTAWNHGRAPILWIVTPTQIRILNAYAHPPNPTPANLQRIEIHCFECIAEQLEELRTRASREAIESGRFWSDLGRSIDRRSRVDAQLIRDLSSAANRLEEHGLNLGEAHRLLLRTLFAGYLDARGWLRGDALHNRVGATSFQDALADPGKAQRVFEWLAETFNGDVFPPTGKSPTYTAAQLEWVRFLLAGGNPATGQQTLWPYDLSVLPVELLSSIYEEFAHALDPIQARARSTHYTPVNLVDLALSEAFDDSHFGNELPLSAQVLDLSCGSGVFLVEALRRLVGRRLAAGERWTRKLVRDTLYNQVFGVDVNAGAVHIAAVSLYLAALELDPNPWRGNGVKFDPLVRPVAPERCSQRSFFNLHAANAFDIEAAYNREKPFAEKAFDVVVGNPPWTRPRGARSAQEPSTEDERNHIAYCTARSIPLPYRKPPDQAFAWRATELAADRARLALFLSAQRFFSQQPASREASAALLRHFAPILVLNLSSLRREGIFPSATHPALLLIAKNCRPQAGESFTFITPLRQVSTRRNSLFSIQPDQIKEMGLGRAVSQEHALRAAVWGQARDLSLLEKLEDKFPSLEKSLASIEAKLKQGFIRGTKRKPVAEELLGRELPCLETEGFRPFELDTSELPPFRYTELERLRAPEIYRGPLLLIRMSPAGSRLVASTSQTDVMYSRRYCGATIGHPFSLWRDAMLGISSSLLGAYWVFMTSPEWGIERDNFYSADLLRLPVPLPAKQEDPMVKRVSQAAARCRRMARAHQEIPAEAWRDLNATVFDLYDLDDEERILVEDMVETTIDLYRKAENSRWMRPTPYEELAAYAAAFAGVVNGYLDVRGRVRLAAEIYALPRESPLRAVRFCIVPRGAAEPSPLRTVSISGMEPLLERIAELLPAPAHEKLLVQRHLRIYGDGELFLVKPYQRHFWTRSAGLRDADTVLAEHWRSR